MPVRITIGLGLLVLTAGVFFQVRTFDFVNLDDAAYVYENPKVQRTLSEESIRWAFTTFYLANYVPVTWLTYFVDYQRAGLDPGAYHVTNLAFHAATTLLLFIVLERMTRRVWPSAFVAALFAVHPLHVESVAWVSERKDVVSGFFWVLTIAAYVAYASRPGLLRYTLVVAAFVLSLLAKPMAVTLPCVLLLLDYWPLERAALRPKFAINWLRLVLEKLPLLAFAAGFSVVALIAQRGSGALPGEAVLGLGDRIANALVSYLLYLAKTLWPADLIPYYPHPKSAWIAWQVAGAALILLGVTIAVWRLRQRAPYALVGWLWYLGTLVPVIGLVQVGSQGMADRYTYLPLIGIFLIAAWAGADVARAMPALRRPVAAAAIAAVLACAVVAHGQTRHWRNTHALFSHTLAVDPRNPVAWAALGEMRLQREEYEQAVPALERAARLDPTNPGVLRNLARAHRRLAQPETAEAVLRRALRLDPTSLQTHNQLALALRDQGRSEEALDHLERALAGDPTFADARINYGNIMLDRGRVADAMSAYRRVLDREPGNARALNNLGAAYLFRGEAADAARYFREALTHMPDDVEARTNLAAALHQLGDTDAARREVAAALARDPENAKARALQMEIEAAEGPANTQLR